MNDDGHVVPAFKLIVIPNMKEMVDERPRSLILHKSILVRGNVVQKSSLLIRGSQGHSSLATPPASRTSSREEREAMVTSGKRVIGRDDAR